MIKVVYLIFLCMHMRLKLYRYACVRVHMCVCVHVCMCIHACGCTYVCCVYVYMYACVYMHVDVRMCALYVCSCMCASIWLIHIAILTFAN